MRMPNDVLEGYPLSKREGLPDLAGKVFATQRYFRRKVFLGNPTGRVVFLAFFPRPPWTCEFCGEEILFAGRGMRCLHVHHNDEDISNNRLINLVPSHGSCHLQEHRRRSRRRREIVDSPSASLRGSATDETNETIGS